VSDWLLLRRYATIHIFKKKIVLLTYIQANKLDKVPEDSTVAGSSVVSAREVFREILEHEREELPKKLRKLHGYLRDSPTIIGLINKCVLSSAGPTS
jgi:hypothetical protein